MVSSRFRLRRYEWGGYQDKDSLPIPYQLFKKAIQDEGCPHALCLVNWTIVQLD